MAYTKDYYHILGLESPGWGATARQNNSTVDLRRAYKMALLMAHPDKKAKEEGGKAARGYTVDDVKEAYAVLANSKTRVEYENWFLRHCSPGTTTRLDEGRGSDFILGLELVDLSDFDVVEASATRTLLDDDDDDDNDTTGRRVQDGHAPTQWTRQCRCGADKGFMILEDELEDAERRGDKEVLVGCEGCSLWVRVGFDVEDEV